MKFQIHPFLPITKLALIKPDLILEKGSLFHETLNANAINLFI
jgi:hypothetical protein